jgi:hypothetical protein
MGSLFTTLVISMRTLILFLTGVSVSVIVLTTTVAEREYDPFAPYSDLMPGQSRDALTQWEFNCATTIIPSFSESCSLTPESGIFSEIQVKFAADTGRIEKTVFLSRENRLSLGDLVLLWGKPEIDIYGRTANLRWHDSHVVAIPQTYRSPVAYRVPLTYIAFEAAD